jgi:CRP/FNR family transcriptional regulator, anaerobic regulatory protein
MLDRWREGGNEGNGEIYLPMTRTDIADYVGLSLAAVSRSFRMLAARRLIVFRDRRHLAIVDRAGLASLELRVRGRR